MHNRLLIALTITAASIPIAGCGSGSPSRLTRSQLIAKADPICKQTNSELRKVYFTRKRAQIPRAVAEFSAYESRAVAELSRLQPPTSMANDWSAIVTSYRQLGSDVVKIGERAKHNSMPDADLASRLAKTQEERAILAGRNGFNDCSKE